MSDAATSPNAVYQPRVVLAGISPLIWRRLLVPTTATIAERHTILRTVFGWSGEHGERNFLGEASYERG